MSEDKVYIMNEVCIPGLTEAGINKDLTMTEICKHCGKTKDKCTCKK